MKSMKNIIFGLVFGVIILMQVFYLFKFYKADKQMIASNREEIANVQRRIDQLEERLAKHEESKKELAQLEIQKTALLNTIPSQTADSKFLTNFFRYLDLMKYTDGSIKQTNVEVTEDELGSIRKQEYEISFISTYTTSRKLIAHLNSMYQVGNISKFIFSTEPQKKDGEERAAYEAFFGNGMNELGQTTFNFSVYYRSEGTVEDEIYQPGRSVKINNEEPFKNQKIIAATSTGGEVSPPVQEPTSEPVSTPALSNSQFNLNIGDLLSSGDTYQLSGPGDGDERYVGLVSQTNAHITIMVREDYYELSIEDESGQVKQTSFYIPIDRPALRIVSTMREIQTVMPNIHVYVYNYSGKIMRVSLEGTLLDNIHIYNEQDQEITKGQTKGNISLT